ncbi:hypothetical protein ACH5RR_020892 [Cinchona calisaya]|uniref:Uncharacterized protein n=1 Tax=Cinchona calisaya TaxID=153742 RepID=A0ABD2ZGY7_9GENT
MTRTGEDDEGRGRRDLLLQMKIKKQKAMVESFSLRWIKEKEIATLLVTGDLSKLHMGADDIRVVDGFLDIKSVVFHGTGLQIGFLNSSFWRPSKMGPPKCIAFRIYC